VVRRAERGRGSAAGGESGVSRWLWAVGVSNARPSGLDSQLATRTCKSLRGVVGRRV
jgi:hypothetical protein